MREEVVEERKDEVLEEVKVQYPIPSKTVIRGYEWAYKLDPMTTSPISESNLKERDFMNMLPLDFLKKATDEALSNSLLIQL